MYVLFLKKPVEIYSEKQNQVKKGKKKRLLGPRKENINLKQENGNDRNKAQNKSTVKVGGTTVQIAVVPRPLKKKKINYHETCLLQHLKNKTIVL